MSEDLQPLRLYRSKVLPEWLDYNGHMNETYYLLIASRATDALIDHIGMHDAFRREFNRTIYTLETHIVYLKEVGEGEPVLVETQILDLDAKRVHLFHSLMHETDRECLCTVEMMMMHIDSTGPRAAPFEPGPKNKLETLFAQHKLMASPSRAGRRIGLK